MRNVVLILSALFVLVACNNKTKEKTTTTSPAPNGEYVQGEILVGFVDAISYKEAIEDIEKNGDVILIDMLMVEPGAVIGHFKVPAGKEKAKIKEIAKHPKVEYAELNMIATIGQN